MKRILFVVYIMLLAVAAQAQIKLHSNGRLTFQTVSNTTTQGFTIEPGPNWTANFNGNVYMNQCAYFLNPSLINYVWMNASKPNNSRAKSWVVAYPSWNNDNFYVLGNGQAYSQGNLLISSLDDVGMKGGAISLIDSKEALTAITSLNGYFVNPEEEEILDLENNEYVDPEAVEAIYADLEKRSVELSAAELSRIIPEAVRTDPQNRLCIDYQSVVTMLVEAVKEQQQKIEALQRVMEENGLMEPQKP